MGLVQQIRSVIERCARPLAGDSDLAERAIRLSLSVKPHCRPPEGELWHDGDADPTGFRHEPDPRSLILPLAATQRCYLIGDLHGDLEAAVSILHAIFRRDMADDEVGNVRVVFLGDLVDRGEQDFEVLELVAALQRILGDAVVQMRGNHEQWRVVDSRVVSTVSEEGRTFLGIYRDRLPHAFLAMLACHFAALPHLVVIEHPRGRIGLLHGGIPPDFLLMKYPREQWLQVPNIRGALLWGRPAIGDRPTRFYPYDSFYESDIADFCNRLDLRLTIRGHDVQERGYDLAAGGQLLTVSSSGRNTRVGAPEGPYPDVTLPRYVELDGSTLLDPASPPSGNGLPAGVLIRETFGRDIVILITGNDEDDARAQFLIAAIHEELQKTQLQAFHIARREQYSQRRTPAHRVLPPRHAEFDPVLDPRAENPFTFELSRAGSFWRFSRWFPPEARHRPTIRSVVEYSDVRVEEPGSGYGDFIRACAQVIIEVAS